jgi:hypothetical protein
MEPVIEMVNEVMAQVVNTPVAAIFVFQFILAKIIKETGLLPDNKYIPLCTMLFMVGGTYQFGLPGLMRFNSSVSDPKVMLILIGFMLWGVGWLLHKTVLQHIPDEWFLEQTRKFLPFLPKPEQPKTETEKNNETKTPPAIDGGPIDGGR